MPEPPTTLEPITSHRGQEAIVAAVAVVARTIRTQHAIVGEVYDKGAQSGIAHGRVGCVAHHWNRRADEMVDVVWHLRYDDEYELTEVGWRIRGRVLTINAIETRPVRQLLPRAPA